MTNAKNMTEYLSFIYKYKSLMNDVCPKILDVLNKDLAQENENPFSLDESTDFFDKKSVDFSGYYIKYKDEYPIYIGLSYNLIESFWDKGSIQATEIQERSKELANYYISVSINKNFFKKRITSIDDSKPIEVSWEKEGDKWVYFNIPGCLLGNKNDFEKMVVSIIKTNFKA